MVISLSLFFKIEQKFKPHVLLILSLLFYGYQGINFLFLIVTLITFSYYSGIILSRLNNHRLLYFSLSCVVVLSFLFFFKYYNFFLNQINLTFFSEEKFSLINIILPLGISFYSFQIIGYLTDVYRKKKRVEKNFVKYSLFISFFPQLVSGPIERGKNLIPQFSFSYNRNKKVKFNDGINLILLGVFKKLVIADNLALHVDKIYKDYEFYTSMDLLFASYMFTLQIFFDFSAYTDIARGSAKLFGVDLMENFKSPYKSKSLHEFWTRWHISLTSWLKDYIYVSLGGNSINRKVLIRNIFLVFIISGIWHGANWTFLVWALIHFNGYSLERFFLKEYYIKIKNLKNKILKEVLNFFNFIVTFNILNFSWIFFRSENLSEANAILGKIFIGIYNTILFRFFNDYSVIDNTLNLRYSSKVFFQSFWFLIIIIALYFFYERFKDQICDKKSNTVLKALYYYFYLTLLLMAGNFGYKEFIYFQF